VREDNEAIVIEVGICKSKQNLKICEDFLFHIGTSKNEAKIFGIRKLSSTSEKTYQYIYEPLAWHLDKYGLLQLAK
jgi:hypothetical protein